MIKIWTLVLGLVAMIAVMPANAGAGCGSCPSDKAKAGASEKKACPVGCEKPCCKPESEEGHDHSGHDHDHGHEGHSH